MNHIYWIDWIGLDYFIIILMDYNGLFKMARYYTIDRFSSI
jgi:hypothetical protein